VTAQAGAADGAKDRGSVERLHPYEIPSEPSVGISSGSSLPWDCSVDDRPPSVATMREAFLGREMLLRGVTYRSNLREAVSTLEADRADLAQHRMDCLRARRKEDRAKAAAWKRTYERVSLIGELRWQLRDPYYRAALAADEVRDGRLVTTPVQTAREEVNQASASMSSPREPPPPRRLLAESSLRPRRPLRQRLRSLHQRRRGRRGSADTAGVTQGSAAREARGSTQAGSVGDFLERDRQVLLDAFMRHDEDQSGSLDPAELPECLHVLGLGPKTSLERDELRQFIWDLDRLEVSAEDFSEEVVPGIREKLKELRRGRLQALFEEVELQGTASLPNLISTLRRHGTFVRETVCDEAYGAFVGAIASQAGAGSRGDKAPVEVPGEFPPSWKLASLHLDDFIDFARLLEEHHDRDQLAQFTRTARLHCLPPDQQEAWRYDLVELHRMFHEYAPLSGYYGSPSGHLTEAQFLAVVRESGYYPKGKQKHLAVELFQKVKRPDGQIGFVDFLSVMRRLRDLDRERLRRAVEMRIPDKFGVTASSDVNHLLRDAGIMARNATEETEIVALAEEGQSHGAAGMGLADVVVLCQRITARIRAMRLEQQRQYVISTGWTEQQFCEFRAAFTAFDEDMSGILERSELLKALDVLKGQFSQSSENIDLVLLAAGLDPEKDMKSDFLTFLRVLKMLDDMEVRREKGASMGFSRERTDRLHSCFQALEPESSGSTVQRLSVQRALTGATARLLPQQQIDELQRALGQEQPNVDFGGWLRTFKMVESFVEGASLEDVLNDLVSWQQAKAKSERYETPRRASLLRLIRDESATTV